MAAVQDRLAAINYPISLALSWPIRKTMRIGAVP